MNEAMGHLKIIFFILCGILLMTSCIPPHHEVLAPEISGVIREGQSPFINSPVYLNTQSLNNCAIFNSVTATDEQGEFTIGPIGKKFKWLPILIEYPNPSWELCVDTRDGRRAILTQGGIGMPPLKLEVNCDLSKTEDNYIKAGVGLPFGNIIGKCTGGPL